MEVVAGSYDEVLLGYRLVKIDEGYQFEQSFTDHSHTGCVKSVAISTKSILASGSTDESIRLFNLKKRSELGSLVHHSGSVTWIEFYKGKHMFSASEDGSICIWKTFTWECLKTLRGHKSAVYCIAVHPSGKLALSVGKDKTLRTWNLVSGKSAFVTNIKQVAEIVLWSPDGESYVLVYSNKIDIYKVETATVYCTISTNRRINDVHYLNERILIYGGDGGVICFHDIKKDRCLHSTDTDTVRVRGLSVQKTDEDGIYFLVTASSDGFIKLWKVTVSQKSISTSLMAQQNTGFRLTCIAVRDGESKPKNSTENVEVDKTVTKKNKQKRDKTNGEKVKITDSKMLQQKNSSLSSKSDGNSDSESDVESHSDREVMSDNDSEIVSDSDSEVMSGSDIESEEGESDSDSDNDMSHKFRKNKMKSMTEKKMSKNISNKGAALGKNKGG